MYWHKDVKRFLAKESNKYNSNVLDVEKDYFKKLIDLVNNGETFWNIKIKYPKAIKDMVGSDLTGIYELRSSYKGFARRVYYFIYENKEVYYLYAETKNGQADTETTSKLTIQILKRRRVEIIKTRAAGLLMVNENKNWSEAPKDILGTDIVLNEEVPEADVSDKTVEVYYNSAETQFSENNMADKFKGAPKVEGYIYDIRKVTFKFNSDQDGSYSPGLVENVSPGSKKKLVVDLVYAVAEKMGLMVSPYAVMQEKDVYYLFTRSTTPDATLIALRGFFDGYAKISDVYNALSKEQIDKLTAAFDDGTVAAFYDDFLPDADVELAKAKLKLLKEMSSPSKIKTQIEPGSKTGTKITDESDIKDINDALTKATPADVDLLLGDGENKGLLEIAMNKATEQIQTDYKTCSQVSSLAYLLLTKLGDNSKDLGQEKETKIDSLITKYTSLDLLVQKYANPTPADSKATLDDILNKKELGKKEFSELFEQNIAREISKEYKSDPTNPMNAVKILVVEGLRRKFETIANTSTVSTDLSSKIITNDYFKSDSKTYQDWKLITEQTEGTELKPKTEDEKRLIDDYETKIRSISDFKINE